MPNDDEEHLAAMHGWVLETTSDDDEGRYNRLMHMESGTFTSASSQCKFLKHTDKDTCGVKLRLRHRVGDPAGVRVWLDGEIQRPEDYWIEDNRYCAITTMKSMQHYHIKYPAESFELRMRRTCGLEDKDG
jgi:hypothetical protein